MTKFVENPEKTVLVNLDNVTSMGRAKFKRKELYHDRSPEKGEQVVYAIHFFYSVNPAESYDRFVYEDEESRDEVWERIKLGYVI